MPCDLNIVKITKPPTEVYRTFTTRIYTYIVTYKNFVVKPLYFLLICESVENTTLLKSYNFVTILLQFVFRSFSAVIHLYTRCLCILIRDSCFLVWGSCWELVGKEVCCRLTYYHPHTQHTHTHINMVRRFPLPWGWYNVHQVCVCSCRGRSQTIRRVCSVSLRVFDIQITL